LSAFLSFLLIIGYLKYPRLKERPGDLIAGISATNMILSIHWTVMYWDQDLKNNNEGCFINGIVALSSGFANYLYNVAFVSYLN